MARTLSSPAAVCIRRAAPACAALALAIAAATAPIALAAAAVTETAGARPVQHAFNDAGSPFDPAATASFDASPAPVLAPGGLTMSEAAAFARSFHATPDGFFARVSLSRYDLVVNGSTSAAAASARGLSEVRVSETETGLAAMFRRDGADYMLEFVCRGPGGETGARCATPEEARALTATLIRVGGG
jgi:hypothetical protein